MSVISSFIITFLAGFSTLLGTLIYFIKDENKTKIISSSLSFSAGVMLFISFFDLIPEAIKNLCEIYNPIFSLIIISIFVIFGFIFMQFIDNLFITNDSELYNVGIISMLAIIIHNIPEGVITFLTTTKDIKLGISLAISIALHNIPEGISIFVPIYYSTKNKRKAFWYTFVSGFSEIIGAVIAWMFMAKLSNDFFFSFLFSLTSGIMIYISSVELIPKSLSYNKKLRSIIYFLIGIFIMLISILI